MLPGLYHESVQARSELGERWALCSLAAHVLGTVFGATNYIETVELWFRPTGDSYLVEF